MASERAIPMIYERIRRLFFRRHSQELELQRETNRLLTQLLEAQQQLLHQTQPAPSWTVMADLPGKIVRAPHAQTPTRGSGLSFGDSGENPYQPDPELKTKKRP